MTRVLITCRQMQNVFDDFRSRFDERGLEYDLPPVVQQPSEDELIAIIGEYDGMIAGDDPLTARVLDHASRMKIISKWGVGIDGIDVAAARTRGIAVTNTPGVFGDDVADVAAGYMVMLARQLHRIHDSISAGGWLKHEGVVLAGKTLGIVGFGTIGVGVARRGRGFGMRVMAFDPDSSAAERASQEGVELVGHDDLFEQSTFVVLCAPLLDSTRHIVNRETLSLMQPGSFLVNVARGGLVEESSLVDALESAQIRAAALDVFENEPFAMDHPLRGFPQCVFGSHNGSNTREGVLRASELAAANLFTGLGVG